MVNRRHVLVGGGAAVLGLGAYLRARSPGKPAGLVDSSGITIEGSIPKRVFVDINAIRQGMIIQSRDISLPVLLFLHGGPGMPEFFLNTTHPTGLEQDFTVVWWKQRGSGLSHSPDIPPQGISIDRRRNHSDALPAESGRERKITLLGHSWGSLLGIQVAAAAPELYNPLIGVGQVAYQLRSEVAAHGFLLEHYPARGDAAMARKFNAAPVSMTEGLSAGWLRLRDGAMHRLWVGNMRDMSSVITGLFIPVWQYRAYEVGEKVNFFCRSIACSKDMLGADFIQTDLINRIHTLDLPIYSSPVLTSTQRTMTSRETFSDQIKALVKGFYTFAPKNSP